MSITKQEIRDLYRKRALRYDHVIWFYRLIGLREGRYRRETVDALSLKPGDTVVDLACGTGLNFPLLEEVVKEEGQIIGVDLTDAMLDRARERVQAAGWQNVDLVQADLAQYSFPSEVAGILSTFAISLIPEYDKVLRRGSAALRAGGRMAIFDLKKPKHWPDWLFRFTAWLNKPFGVSVEVADRHPWESISRYLQKVLFREYYFGYLYLSVGEAPKL